MKVYNILWLKFIKGSVKKSFFPPVKISSVLSKPFFLVHVALNACDSANFAPLLCGVTRRL